MGKVSKAKEDLAQATQQEQTLTVQRNALEDTKANAGENRKIIEQVHQQIPPTVDEGGLFNLINKAALDSGFPIVNIGPSTPTFDDQTGLSTIVWQVSAVGTYSDVTALPYPIDTVARGATLNAPKLIHD